jgi:signal transduction histidine kinase
VRLDLREAVLAERARIARELHDTLLQGFTGITLQLDGLRGMLEERGEPLAHDLSAILRCADRTLREAREMVWDIRSPELVEADLEAALEAVCRGAVTDDGIALRHVVTGPRRALPSAVETTILRVGREAVCNSVRHGSPAAVMVHLAYEPREVRLEVHDDGCGADADELDAAPRGGHWGIAGMRERASRAGGVLVVNTMLGKGMRVSLSLPTEPVASR